MVLLTKDRFVAVAFEGGSAHDYAYNWQTAQTMANEGYRMVALADDGILSRDELQRMVDCERELVLDCFGPEALR